MGRTTIPEWEGLALGLPPFSSPLPELAALPPGSSVLGSGAKE